VKSSKPRSNKPRALLAPHYHPDGREAGCDEAGRGCLAGPVCAAAVVLDAGVPIPEMIRDSKQLTPKRRELAAEWVEAHAARWAVAYCSPEEIDEINILRASFKAMHRALQAFPEAPDRILVDGHRFDPFEEVPHHCIIKGDGKYASIAAASILAKTYRDRLMQLWHLDYPDYQWHSNKGYPTQTHIQAIRERGITPLHRRSFTIKGKQLKMGL
jgi:ribonuclease HII